MSEEFTVLDAALATPKDRNKNADFFSEQSSAPLPPEGLLHSPWMATSGSSSSRTTTATTATAPPPSPSTTSAHYRPHLFLTQRIASQPLFIITPPQKGGGPSKATLSSLLSSSSLLEEYLGLSVLRSHTMAQCDESVAMWMSVAKEAVATTLALLRASQRTQQQHRCMGTENEKEMKGAQCPISNTVIDTMTSADISSSGGGGESSALRLLEKALAAQKQHMRTVISERDELKKLWRTACEENQALRKRLVEGVINTKPTVLAMEHKVGFGLEEEQQKQSLFSDSLRKKEEEEKGGASKRAVDIHLHSDEDNTDDNNNRTSAPVRSVGNGDEVIGVWEKESTSRERGAVGERGNRGVGHGRGKPDTFIRGERKSAVAFFALTSPKASVATEPHRSSNRQNVVSRPTTPGRARSADKKTNNNGSKESTHAVFPKRATSTSTSGRRGARGGEEAKRVESDEKRGGNPIIFSSLPSRTPRNSAKGPAQPRKTPTRSAATPPLPTPTTGASTPSKTTTHIIFLGGKPPALTTRREMEAIQSYKKTEESDGPGGRGGGGEGGILLDIDWDSI